MDTFQILPAILKKEIGELLKKDKFHPACIGYLAQDEDTLIDY